VGQIAAATFFAFWAKLPFGFVKYQNSEEAKHGTGAAGGHASQHVILASILYFESKLTQQISSYM